VSLASNVPAGLLTDVRLYNQFAAITPDLINLDLRKAPSLEWVQIENPEYTPLFRGTSGSTDRTFDLHNRNRLNSVRIGHAPIITTVNISHPQTVDTIEPTYISAISMTGMTSINLSGWCDGLFLNNMPAMGVLLDLSNMQMDSETNGVTLQETGSITTVSLPTGTMLIMKMDDGTDFIANITSQGTDTIRTQESFVRDSALDDAGIYALIDAFVDPTDLSNPFASTTINFTGTPAAGTLSAPTIALAASKNITLIPVA
jgi:hypothetical protein